VSSLGAGAGAGASAGGAANRKLREKQRERERERQRIERVVLSTVVVVLVVVLVRFFQTPNYFYENTMASVATSRSPLLFESTPYISYPRPHRSYVRVLVELNDGSIVSGSFDESLKRWMRTNNNNYNGNSNTLTLLGTYYGHRREVVCAMESDDNTLLSGSWDDSIKVWNTTTYECLNTIPSLQGSSIWAMTKTKDQTRFLCGRDFGTVEIRRVSDLGLISSLTIHKYLSAIRSICELEDGSFVSAGGDEMKRWEETGKVLKTFSGHSEYIERVIELKKDVIVSAADDTTLKMWRVSTGDCLRTLTFHSGSVYGLEKLRDGVFVSGSLRDKKIVVWDENGNIIETHQSKSVIDKLILLRDGSMVTSSEDFIEIRRL